VGLYNQQRGGGILNDGTLTVTNSTFSGNIAGGGGGIANQNGGTLNLTNSTLTGNRGDDGAGIINFGTLTVTNSTLTGNLASPLGGGIYNQGTLTVTNSTLTGNVAGDIGGGIYNGSALNLTNTIVAGNYAYLLIPPIASDVFGTVTTNSHNLIGGTPLLSALGSYGGPTQTVALLPGSPTIERATIPSAPQPVPPVSTTRISGVSPVHRARTVTSARLSRRASPSLRRVATATVR